MYNVKKLLTSQKQPYDDNIKINKYKVELLSTHLLSFY